VERLREGEARRLQLLDDAGGLENEIRELRAEVERLRATVADFRLMIDGLETAAHEERAAVVAWLRDEAARLRKVKFVGSRAYVLESTAYLIENGVHADQNEKT
jgi:hypothetical protein